ncbi:par-3 family cell polarity regulator beta a [Chanos chanos]|uniref:Par-3 family cell polarity regulator beta a n=1 Tax=Chanos chanos TaxID=29144 RepID=A0A6J2VSE0_CHACN|nr:partitioning defective 3 homolog B-like [Chanos chanos]
MKVTVTFGKTGVVVPCKKGWMVRDLIDQATQRYKKIVEQDGEFLVRTHHVEYSDGGILDPDDMLSDVVEDKDKLVAVFEEEELQQRAVVSPGGSVASGHSSPDPYEPELRALDPHQGSEIEVNSSALLSNNTLLVRSSSDPALTPRLEVTTPESDSYRAPATGSSHGLTVKGGASERPKFEMTSARTAQALNSSLTKTVEICGDRGPLGIKVVPYCSSLSGRTLGLLVCGIEENSRCKREGIFQEDECIVQINDTPLIDKSFAQAQEVFRQAMASSSLVRLEVLPTSNKQRYEKSLIGQLFIQPDGPESTPKVKSPFLLRAATNSPTDTRRSETPPSRSPEPLPPVTRPAPVEPERHTETTPPLPVSSSPTPKGRSESPQPKKNPALTMLMNAANRKGSKKLKIDLKKGTEGLGFTVVTRDSSVHGPGPILVKSILPRGAAIKDGRLQSGDRILEVNGVDISGRTQEELVAMLRSTKLGETVSVVVARQEEMFLPRELKGEPSGPPVSEDGREQLMFEVPLNDTGSAGLGVSLKGNKSRETGEDLGIFIKSIIHGGAAYKDGRLHVNDQLVAVNSESLVGRSNHDAMETLRRSMSMEGNLRGTIQLVVLRAVDRPSAQEAMTNQNQAVELPHDQQPYSSQPNGTSLPPMVTNNIYETSPVPHRPSNGVYEPPEEDYNDEDFPPPPANLMVESDYAPHQSQLQTRVEREPSPGLTKAPLHQQQQENKPPEYYKTWTSKSMDLESSPGAATALGPRLGLQKSSSLESLQTAMSEATKPEVPFHRPPTHMVRGRGCNQSFRHAIDKSYDGPSEPEEDDSDESSGRDTPVSSSSRQELEDGKSEKTKKKKKKEKKSKAKKKDDGEDTEKKTKKRGFGLLRFGRKNKEDKAKAKAKLGALSEEEMDRSEGEVFNSQSERSSPAPDRVLLPDVEDDDLDPNYARINNFREPPVSTHTPYQASGPAPPYTQPTAVAPSREAPMEDPREGLYAKVNKQRTAPPPAVDSNERLQQIRRELQKTRPAPAYAEHEARHRAQDYDTSRVARVPEPRMAPRYDEVDRQYASVPRRIAVEDYHSQARGGPRDPGRYPNPAPTYDAYPPRQGSPRLPVPRSTEGADGYYPSPPPHHRGPIRQDVPPSSIPIQRGAPSYETVSAAGYRASGPNRYTSYDEEYHQDPRQKNPMIGAV